MVFACVVLVAATVSGQRRRALLPLGVGGLGVAVTLFGWALIRVQSSIRDVAEVSSRARPPYERLAGLWGGSRPSLLLFALFLGIATLFASRTVAPVCRAPCASPG